jgi:hypothetical protein
MDRKIVRTIALGSFAGCPTIPARNIEVGAPSFAFFAKGGNHRRIHDRF